MTRTVDAPKTKAPVITAADYFAAKLAYEMTPWTLKGLIVDGKATSCGLQPSAVCVLDVRSPDAYRQGHVPGAISIPLAELSGKIVSLPKNKTIVTYCANITCALAPKAALELAQKGFKVMELYGGIATWQEYGFPIEKKS